LAYGPSFVKLTPRETHLSRLKCKQLLIANRKAAQMQISLQYAFTVLFG
jgi:hypothetical protein